MRTEDERSSRGLTIDETQQLRNESLIGTGMTGTRTHDPCVAGLCSVSQLGASHFVSSLCTRAR